MIYSKEQTQDIFQQNFAFIQVEEKENVLTITLNRPEKKNAFHQIYLNVLFIQTEI